ncbi:ribonuclease E inhibitor RraA/Dimethylmenaquinone methyltransferase [Pyronema domesticum]|uniref:Similar to Uncharacterized protein YER010C acc. no. P40011 n=1 Tax=Pyronema omphalodes (strain CBS 100304) TaxID=1076935 RepID=U4L5S7_PYROM|nr:ribonuclease E inhibitor RraA/Dimethylmenaquinone methyltransferase [Pyronema domesticum]CCX12551.1 Similar to Uncharacterized protein YER010C; acc. no. P40011 [Pyronema omphalodes CBS 100304]
MSASQLAALSSGNFTPCDIADALLKLKVPHAGYLVDIDPKHTPTAPRSGPLVGLATTVLFAPKSSPTPAGNLEKGAHFADVVSAPNTIAVLAAPPGVRCAVLGGLVATRLAKRGVKGVIIGGRVRDLWEMPEDLEIWAQGTSAVGAGAETRVVDVDVEVEVRGVKINKGDVVVADKGEVVVIPGDKVQEVLDLMPGLMGMDELVAGDLKEGKELGAAFKERRG